MRLIALAFILCVSSVAAFARSPVLITEPGSTRAIALESTFFTREPFHVNAPAPLTGGDNKTRITFFVLFPEPPSLADNLTVYARAGGTVYYFEVQHFAKVPGQQFYALSTRLFNEPPETGDLLVRVHWRGIWSNAGRIGFGLIGGGLPDESLPHPLTSPCPSRKIVFDGDSMTRGNLASQWNEDFADATTYPSQVIRLLACGETLHNFGVVGQTVAQMDADAAAQVDSILQGDSKNVVAAWGATNDLAVGADVAITYGQLVQYYQARRAHGPKAIAVTMLPRSDQWITITGSLLEQRRQQLNSLIRANWPTFADSLVDLAADPELGDAGDELGRFYAADRVHLNDAGNLRVALAITTAIQALP